MKETISSEIYENLSSEALKSYALNHGEAKSTPSGAIAVETGKRTGRSPKDRFIVKDKANDQAIHWGKINQPIDIELFNRLWERTEKYLNEKKVFISHLRVGADDSFGLPVKVITEAAWHNLFAQHLFIHPQPEFSQTRPHWTILSAIDFKTDPQRDGVNSDGTIMLDLSGRRVLICGMAYAGEMKKAMFTVMNYLLPAQDVLPMHCAANVGENGDVALFFGLSGTGKTTLSADPSRYLIGDDEHGWSKDGVFNFEGGCYAKCIHLSKEREPVIWQALRDGAIMENVVLKGAENEPDFSDESLTQNTRAAYPREFIEKRVMSNRGGIPKAVIFLTCDLYGVLPPIALLNNTQAAYHFLSGYTALVGSTQMGGPKGISTTFSVCFGAPFFPRPARVYADLLMKRLEESNCPVYLVNTGWTSGAYGQGGERFSIPVTRAVVQAAISGGLKNKEYDLLPGFNFKIPKTVDGVEQRLLIPHNTWSDKKAYNIQLNTLIQKFQENFAQMGASKIVADAGPQLIDV